MIATSSSHVVHSLILNHWDASDFWSARSAPQQKTVPYVAHSRKNAKLCMVLLSQKGVQNMSATHFMCKSVYNIDIITLCSSALIYFFSLLLLCTYYSRVYPPMTSFNPLLNQPLILSVPAVASPRRHFFSQVQDISFACLKREIHGRFYLKCQRLENEFPLYVPF